MDWAALKSKRVRAAYDAETRDLHVKFPGSPPVNHADIPPHVYQNLLETDDPYFYYQYYIAPSRVSPGRRQPVSVASYAVKLVLLLAACSLLMATGLDPDHGGTFEESELRSN
ncbi:KTSC domain-containing protein [Rhizobium sp. WYCCWR 11279]|uniref:KTSC domain-containing protein n=1 Tax=Rhizobium changzhiense TaxID=2692317 RepID=A0A7Z0UBB1_9HYPH|nr:MULTISPECIES: KTSC domain-containing protein [Rhizobium]MCH4546939.1 KTSC domain-containing protein [Rhizobium changzhiense]MCV9943097.1 KTSC domain-containing protein [Rhizobium sp. BT-175]MCW0014994.1 KTSC domain-containing protein [Rhizobium sp. BT-226]NNU47446.1 KTSC domain-containing protein [Rhizobium changzhiense]NZD62997.1 KTSC domain-containing protein [Rhizobium changzhiense]